MDRITGRLNELWGSRSCRCGEGVKPRRPFGEVNRNRLRFELRKEVRGMTFARVRGLSVRTRGTLLY